MCYSASSVQNLIRFRPKYPMWFQEDVPRLDAGRTEPHNLGPRLRRAGAGSAEEHDQGRPRQDAGQCAVPDVGGDVNSAANLQSQRVCVCLLGSFPVPPGMTGKVKT